MYFVNNICKFVNIDLRFEKSETAPAAVMTANVAMVSGSMLDIWKKRNSKFLF
jgi:hypothetical protein